MLFDFSNPEAFWLDVTNAALGVLCLVCFLALAWAIGRDVAVMLRRRSMRLIESSPHVLSTPELGATMADGGHPIDAKERTDKPSPSNRERS